MLHMLFDGGKETSEILKGVTGKRITALRLGEDDALHFAFEDGQRVKLRDAGQSCCENRYMRTDDNLSDWVGTVFTCAEVRDAPNAEAEDGVHEIQFLLINTDKGVFTMSSHNAHNGYYGGFWIVAEREED